ncbi:MAG: hypothetical protein ACI88H_003656 [Cocleimonas sp.]|jgi:hypothetical protein
MNISSQSLLASTLLTILLAGTSAFAEGRAGDLSDYSNDSYNQIAAEVVEVKKASLQTPIPTSVH